MIRRISAMAGLAILGTAAFLIGAATSAQDAAKVDPKHYKVVLENDQVRVLRITYGPHEKSVMHSHPPGVVVYLSDAHGKFTLPGGKTQDAVTKAGTVAWTDATTHMPENTGDKEFEVIQVELKTNPAAAK
jgi:quercetin dioxygenase-like cupin family protein